MATLSYLNIKASSMAKDAEDKRNDVRDKAMILFTFNLLLEKGYLNAATALANECSLNLENYTMCENIDLKSIFVDFEAYFQIRFQRVPQYFKKAGPNSSESLQAQLNKHRSSKSRRTTQTTPKNGIVEGDDDTENVLNRHQVMSPYSPSQCDSSTNFLQGKLLDPVSGMDFASEDMRVFADCIQKEIVVDHLNTTWNSVVGLAEAKRVLAEAIVFGREINAFFGSAIPPWRGLLLYGPPGTGKTLLAKAVASECQTTFFNITSATVVSKWRGDSEKIVKVLFKLARHHAPSTIFFDEFEALGSHRESSGETDASRRLKAAFLQEMDGLLALEPSKPVFILAATNLPWEVDPAILRRLEKRVFIDLPNVQGRSEMLKMQLENISNSVYGLSHGRNGLDFSKVDFAAVANVGYSGSDITQIVKEVVFAKYRNTILMSSQNGDSAASCKTKGKLVVDTDDILKVVQCTKPTVDNALREHFIKWNSSQ